MEKILCGVDLGGTKLSVGLADSEGHLLDKTTVYDHATKSEDEIVKQIVHLVSYITLRNKLQESDLLGIGVGIAGHINYKKGEVITTSNFSGFKNYPFREKLQAHFAVPVIMDNDANAQTFGTFKFGAGRGYDDMIFMTLSTGIGIGIITGKKLYRGQTGTAGEFGHTIVKTDSRFQCTCGNYGCLMAHASGLALPVVYRDKVDTGTRSIYTRKPSFDYNQVDGKFLTKGLKEGDPASQETVHEIAFYAGIGIYNLFQIFNPPLILLGGGLLNLGDTYLNQIKRTFYDHVHEMLYDPIEIRVSQLGPDTGLLGAAALLLEEQ